jgi:uncharacterized protein
LFFAPGFCIFSAAALDCKTAASPRDVTVCSNAKLHKLQDAVTAEYDRLQQQLSPESAAAIQSDQREWLAWLDAFCSGTGRFPSAICLSNEYDGRLEQLGQGTVAGASPTIFTRAHFLIVPAKPGATASASSSDPGYGTARFSWPQIDRPTPGQQVWNQQVQAAAVHLAAGKDASTTPFPAALDGSADPHSESVLSYDLNAANEHLVVVDLVRYRYEYGGAHGTTDDSSFSWWLDKNRPLEASDIFRPDSGWQAQLIEETVAKLHADPDLRPMLWKGKELTAGASEAVDPSRWAVSQDGLTVRFEQYAVAAYAAGGGSVHFTWQELQPLLAPSLDINQLPPTANR